MRRSNLLVSACLVLAGVAAGGSMALAATWDRPASDESLSGRVSLDLGSTAHPNASDGLPTCRYQDISTRYHTLRDWRRSMLDTNLRLGRGYKPTDLRSTSAAGIAGSGKVRAFVIPDLQAMARAARRAGAGIAVQSAYRSYQEQVRTFAGWVARSGYRKALKFSARPGHSEHQLGTTIDFRSASSALPPWSYSDWAQSSSGRWMGKHSWEYGFILSYPKGKTSETCYGYEPWHFRYVGRDEARLVHQSGLTLRRYLWRNFETAQ